MFSNSIIVFLRDLLPLFLMYAFLSVLTSPQKREIIRWVLYGCVGLLIAFAFSAYAEDIGSAFEGAGIELLKTMLLIMAWVSLIVFTLSLNVGNKLWREVLFSVGVISLIALKAAEFQIYFHVVTQFASNIPAIVLGCVMGLGLCVSFCLLFKFLLTELFHSRWYWTVIGLWLAFLAGQMSHAVNYLSQVDWIDVRPSFINMREVIDDGSEYGHVLNALLGYDASPSVQYLSVYVFCLVVPLFMYAIFVSRKIDQPSKNGDKYHAI